MRIELILKNYRCFPDSSPAHIIIEDNWTAFVGVNNAGKSTLLRFFYEFRQLFKDLSNVGVWQDMARGGKRGMSFGNNVRDVTEVYHNQSQRPLSVEFRVSPTTSYPYNGAPRATSVTFEYRQDEPSIYRLVQLFSNERDEFPLGDPVRLADTLLTRGDIRVDIAPYRDAMERLSKTFYIGAFRNVLNTGSKDDYFDIQVGDAFITRWRNMQTGNTKRENIACEAVVNTIERLFGYKRLAIQAAQTNDTLQLVIDGKPYKLHELGAGLAQFILVLANAAVAQSAYILIDEPELNLHPSLQLDFLTALGGFARSGMLFTTHSIGLARSTADRIYSVLRIHDGVSRVVPYEATPNLAEFLGAMSYSSYHALGFSKVLMVEGPTEVRTIQQFLRKLGKDHQILLLQLGGSSQINSRSEHELSELKRITPDLFALIDSEKASATAPLHQDREGFRATCRKLGIDCHVLDYRALENYLTESAIQRVKGDKYRQLGAYESLKSANPGWAKQENWRIAGEMSWDDIMDTDLGKFLERL
jgi:predicted ATPase